MLITNFAVLIAIHVHSDSLLSSWLETSQLIVKIPRKLLFMYIYRYTNIADSKSPPASMKHQSTLTVGRLPILESPTLIDNGVTDLTRYLMIFYHSLIPSRGANISHLGKRKIILKSAGWEGIWDSSQEGIVHCRLFPCLPPNAFDEHLGEVSWT